LSLCLLNVGLLYVGSEKESKDQNSTAKKSNNQRRTESQLEALLRSAAEAGHHRSLTGVNNCESNRLASEDEDSAATKYQIEFRRLVLATLLRSVEVTRPSESEEWPARMDRRTAACLYDGGGEYKLSTPVDDQLRRAIDEDVQSEGGHRAVVLQGAEGSGRTTALRRFVQLVTECCPELPLPLVVARRTSWPGRTSVDLLCDVVDQLSSVINTVDTPADDDDDDGVPPHIRRQHTDLDSLVKTYSYLLRAFSESSIGRLVIAVDGLEHVRRGGTVSGGNISWLAVPLPVRVHVICTYLTGHEPDTSSLAAAAVDTSTVRTIDLEGLSETAVNQVVADAFRRRRRRSPVDGRLSVIMQLTGTKPQAAYVALFAEEFAARAATMTATSEQQEKLVKQLKNIEKIAKQRFKRVERHYGKLVVCTAFI